MDIRSNAIRLNEASRFVTIQWIASHVAISGNQRDDKLATREHGCIHLSLVRQVPRVLASMCVPYLELLRILSVLRRHYLASWRASEKLNRHSFFVCPLGKNYGVAVQEWGRYVTLLQHLWDTGHNSTTTLRPSGIWQTPFDRQTGIWRSMFLLCNWVFFFYITGTIHCRRSRRRCLLLFKATKLQKIILRMVVHL